MSNGSEDFPKVSCIKIVDLFFSCEGKCGLQDESVQGS